MEEDQWFEDVLTAARPPLEGLAKRTPHLRIHARFTADLWKDPDGSIDGRYAEVATIDPNHTVMLWLDRYLQASAPSHLGLWVHGTRRATSEIANRFAATRGDYLEVTNSHRDESQFVADGRVRVAGLRSRPLLDVWSARNTFFGWYVALAPTVHPAHHAVPSVLDAFREMLDVLGIDLVTGQPELDEANDRIASWCRRLMRPEQPAFRRALLREFGGRCCVSGCDVEDVLEAAHIVEVNAGGTDLADNGLLLRVDLHRLFDLRMLRIRGAPLRVWIHPTIRNTFYGAFHDEPLRASIVGRRLGFVRLREQETSDMNPKIRRASPV